MITTSGIHAVSTLHGRRRPAMENRIYEQFWTIQYRPVIRTKFFKVCTVLLFYIDFWFGLRFRELYQFQFRRHRHPADSYHNATDIDAFLRNTLARSDEPRQDYSTHLGVSHLTAQCLSDTMTHIDTLRSSPLGMKPHCLLISTFKIWLVKKAGPRLRDHPSWLLLPMG